MIIGIDLGTTNSLVAIYNDGLMKIIPNRFNENLTPSVISLMEKGEMVVGKTAKERLIIDPVNTFSAFKRNIGTTKKYNSDSVEFTPIELSSIILKNIVDDAKNQIDEPIDKVVISVPAYFTDLQRKATLEAARIAGLDTLGIVNEPTAAALAYHLHETERERVIGIVDLGGGTFDVSILDIYDSVIEVKAVAGDNYLGGEDFDYCIAEFVCSKYGLDFEKQNLTDKNKLKYIAEQIKRVFDSEEHIDIEVNLSNINLKIHLNKDEFEEACVPVIARLKEPVRKALIDAQIDPMDVEEVVLVGGSTKMPIVKSQIARLFGRTPLSYLNPDEVVAKGAAVYAALRDKNVKLQDMVMTDVCPYTLGTETMVLGSNGEYYKKLDPIIERNMTVPISRANQYVAIDDSQKELNIKIYQGEHPNPDENVFLGEIKHEIASGSEKDSMTTVRFTYDRNGILEVVTQNHMSNDRKRAIMLNNNTLSDDEVEACLNKLGDLKLHPYENEENLYLISKAEKLYSLAAEENKEKIYNSITFFREAINSGNKVRITKANDLLMKMFDEFEEKV